MAITLAHDGDTFTLPAGLAWTDEYAWHPVQQRTARSTTGALLVDVAQMVAGRPITLEGRETEAWITRELCDLLRALAALAGEEMTLTLRGVARTVIFDHERGAGFEAEPLWHLWDGEEDGEQLFRPTLRFLET